MTTICSTCGSSLAADVRFCPHCGTPTFSHYASSGASPYEPTAPAAPFQTSSQIPATAYGVNPYGVPLQNPYEPLNPYEAPLRPPPPPTSHRPVKLGLLAGLLVLILVLVSGSVFAFLIEGTKRDTSRPTPMLTITPVQTSGTATHTSTPQHIYIQATSGNPVLTDPMSGQDANNWDVNSAKDSGCIFEGGAYHIVSFQVGYYTPCVAQATNFSNFAFQVEMTVIKGNGGGLFCRAGGAEPYGYRFFVGRDYFDVNYHDKQLTVSTAFTAKLNQTYLLTVIARGSSMSLYVDKQWIATVEDNSTSSGAIGLLAFQGEVVFRNAKVWTL